MTKVNKSSEAVLRFEDKEMVLPIISGTENEKALVKELRDEIKNHIQSRYEIFVPAYRFNKIISKYGRYRSKNGIENENLKHRNRYVIA